MLRAGVHRRSARGCRLTPVRVLGPARRGPARRAGRSRAARRRPARPAWPQAAFADRRDAVARHHRRAGPDEPARRRAAREEGGSRAGRGPAHDARPARPTCTLDVADMLHGTPPASDDEQAMDRTAGDGRAPSQADLLPGWYEDWVLFERERLQQVRLDALESPWRAARSPRATRRPALAAAREAIAIEPLLESAHAVAIQAHLLGGNRSAAVREYQEYRRQPPAGPGDRAVDRAGRPPGPAPHPASGDGEHRPGRAGTPRPPRRHLSRRDDVVLRPGPAPPREPGRRPAA